jgi:hypothetical protein
VPATRRKATTPGGKKLTPQELSLRFWEFVRVMQAFEDCAGTSAVHGSIGQAFRAVMMLTLDAQLLYRHGSTSPGGEDAVARINRAHAAVLGVDVDTTKVIAIIEAVEAEANLQRGDLPPEHDPLKSLRDWVGSAWPELLGKISPHSYMAAVDAWAALAKRKRAPRWRTMCALLVEAGLPRRSEDAVIQIWSRAKRQRRDFKILARFVEQRRANP